MRRRATSFISYAVSPIFVVRAVLFGTTATQALVFLIYGGRLFQTFPHSTNYWRELGNEMTWGWRAMAVCAFGALAMANVGGAVGRWIGTVAALLQAAFLVFYAANFGRTDPPQLGVSMAFVAFGAFCLALHTWFRG